MGSTIARLCKHDECELKKRLNFCKQYKIFTAFCDFIPKCRSWRIVDAVKDKKGKKIKIKTAKAKETTKIKDCRQAGIRITIPCMESKDHNHWTTLSYYRLKIYKILCKFLYSVWETRSNNILRFLANSIVFKSANRSRKS